MKDRGFFAIAAFACCVGLISLGASCMVSGDTYEAETCLALAKAKQDCLKADVCVCSDTQPCRCKPGDCKCGKLCHCKNCPGKVAKAQCCGCCEGGECKCKPGECKCGDCCSCQDCPGKRAKRVVNDTKTVSDYQAGYGQALKEDKPFLVCVNQPADQYVAQLPEVVVVPVRTLEGDPTPRVVVGVPFKAELRTYGVYLGSPPVYLIRDHVVTPRIRVVPPVRRAAPPVIRIGEASSVPAYYPSVQAPVNYQPPRSVYPPTVRSGGGC